MLNKLMLSLVGVVAAIARAILICFPQQFLALNRSGRSIGRSGYCHMTRKR